MIKNPRNPIITPKDVVPSHEQLVVKGALNPGAVRMDDEIILLLRVAEGCKKQPGKVTVPVYRFGDNGGELEILKWEAGDPKLSNRDNRSVIYDGDLYVSTLSHLRIARSTNGVDFTVDDRPFLLPRNR